MKQKRISKSKTKHPDVEYNIYECDGCGKTRGVRSDIPLHRDPHPCYATPNCKGRYHFKEVSK